MPRLSSAAITALLTALLLSGCGTIYFPTDEDQSNSFAAYEGKRIKGESVERYILRRTIPLLPSEGTSKMLDAVEIEGTGRWDPISGSALATAVSHDGYFLTADHVVERHPPYRAETEKGGFVIVQGRTVRRFPMLDLALIKFDEFRTPYFQMAPTPPPNGEILLSGGPPGVILKQAGPNEFFTAGPVSRVQSIIHSGVPSFKIGIEIPNRPGSSGGPVIDERGQLHGIVVAGRYGRFAKRRIPLTYTRMIQSGYLESLIREDRAKN